VTSDIKFVLPLVSTRSTGLLPELSVGWLAVDQPTADPPHPAGDDATAQRPTGIDAVISIKGGVISSVEPGDMYEEDRGVKGDTLPLPSRAKARMSL